MVHIRWFPVIGTVATIARVQAIDMVGIFANDRAVIMTAETRCSKSRMIDACRPPGDSIQMTIIAFILANDMRRPLSCGPDTIVTGVTGGSDSSMIETGRFPRNRTMTIVAIVTAREMGRTLAGSLETVMTVKTRRSNCYVIHARISPTDFGMTIIADVAAFDVIRWFARGTDQTGRSMTTLATLWSSFENTVLMTAFTTLSGMRTVQEKASSIMVKFSFSLGDAGYREQGQQNKQKRY